MQADTHVHSHTNRHRENKSCLFIDQLNGLLSIESSVIIILEIKKTGLVFDLKKFPPEELGP